MKFHGVAIAITGDDPVNVKLSCTVTSIPMDDRRNVEVLDDLTFDIEFDMSNLESTTKALEEISNSLSMAVGMQMLEFDNSDYEFRPVALVLGQQGGKSYDLKSLMNNIFGSYLTDGFEKYENLYNKLSLALENCTLDFGSYGAISISDEAREQLIQKLESEGLEENDRLVELKPKLDAGNTEALEEIIKIAEDRARFFVKVRGAVNNNFREQWKSRFTS